MTYRPPGHLSSRPRQPDRTCAPAARRERWPSQSRSGARERRAPALQREKGRLRLRLQARQRLHRRAQRRHARRRRLRARPARRQAPGPRSSQSAEQGEARNSAACLRGARVALRAVRGRALAAAVRRGDRRRQAQVRVRARDGLLQARLDVLPRRARAAWLQRARVKVSAPARRAGTRAAWTRLYERLPAALSETPRDGGPSAAADCPPRRPGRGAPAAGWARRTRWCGRPARGRARPRPSAAPRAWRP